MGFEAVVSKEGGKLVVGRVATGKVPVLGSDVHRTVQLGTSGLRVIGLGSAVHWFVFGVVNLKIISVVEGVLVEC